MITNVIVITALVFAAIYVVIWKHGKHMKQRIEAPKYRFQQQVEQYDRQLHQHDAGDTGNGK